MKFIASFFINIIPCLKMHVNSLRSLDNPRNFRKDDFEHGKWKLKCRHSASDHFRQPEVGSEWVTTMPVLCLAFYKIFRIGFALT